MMQNMKPGSSPINVIDFSTLVVELKSNDEKKLQLPELTTPLSPPLESITTFCTEDEDNDSLSTISMQQNEDDETGFSLGHDSQDTSEKRSIFSKYWEKEAIQEPRLPTDRRRSVDDSPDQLIPEDPSQHQVQPRKEKHFFPSNDHSELSISIHSELASMWFPAKTLSRSTRSDSALVPGHPSSILRRSNLDVRQRRHSVTFDDRVDVYIFCPARENWTCEGWKGLFSFWGRY